MSITGHSDVDMESASAFSPSEPSVDGVFVSKHNQSAEMYQRILHTCENMYVVFEDEKQHLMGDVLLSWAMKQQRVSIGTLWTQQLHYKQLDVIHLQFEYFGELLQQTLSGLTYLKQYFPSASFDEVGLFTGVSTSQD
ncbi:hypothetical protein ANCCEY_08300 [Ancylostoma ceylanicum]|uniref:Signal transducer and activator of transcription b N-terminal domain-containing protein n=1 Tax=Ancylostoma ceylanicum TaxID=53326 RepID=A0A0D6LKL0_9BILA|nr:hypothetical protein ANCCEY_08300 [Ancylostoma ceylanicum]